MATARTSLDEIADFLAQKRIAMAGLSRNPASISASLFDDLCRRGYDVVPVNPNAVNIKGRTCFARMQDIEPPVEAALLLTSPETTKKVVRDCAEAGIHRIWMYSAGGQGAVDQSAVHFCQEHNIHVIPGECPFMFLPHAGAVHRVHGLFRKITGRYPRHRETVAGVGQ